MKKFEEYYNQFIKLLPNLALGVVVLVVTIIIAAFIRKFIVKKLKTKTRNPILLSFIGKMIALSINIVGFIIFLGIIGLGNVSSKLIAGAGILTFVIGFAFKDIGENFLSGILLAFKSPFRVNDLIETESIIGYVLEVNLRETVIKTLEGKDVFVPNSQILKNPLINYTVDGFLRYNFVIGIAPNSDIDKAIDIIERTVYDNDEVLKSKKPDIIIDELKTNIINIKAFYWIDTFKSRKKSYHNQIRSKLIKDTIQNLKDANIH